jgi:hypothetical protein
MRINSSNGTLTALSLLMGNGSRIGRFGRIYNFCKAQGSPNPLFCALGGPPKSFGMGISYTYGGY